MLIGIPHLLPQMPDVGGDGVVIFGVVFVSPDQAEQLFRADHAALPLAQNLQNGELGRRQG